MKKTDDLVLERGPHGTLSAPPVEVWVEMSIMEQRVKPKWATSLTSYFPKEKQPMSSSYGKDFRTGPGQLGIKEILKYTRRKGRAGFIMASTFKQFIELI
ncbi:MAG: hypothetical protein AAFX53_18680 [Bacteroidota bacterium]